MKQAMIDARIDMINNIDPRMGNVRDQQELIKNLPILSKHFISDDIEEED